MKTIPQVEEKKKKMNFPNGHEFKYMVSHKQKTLSDGSPGLCACRDKTLAFLNLVTRYPDFHNFSKYPRYEGQKVQNFPFKTKFSPK